jgi:alpha-glucosidase
MLLGVRMVSSLGLTGVAFAGYDVGGFVGDANKNLFARWISIGALSPFFRGHTMINSRDSEPWSYGEEVEQISRNYIKFRYQLMPYLYALFYEASQTGMPVQRSLAIDYPFSYKVYDHLYHNQYLLGPFILVAPVDSGKELARVYLPAGEWYYVFDSKKYSGEQDIIVDCPIHRLPIFVKAGAILPMQKASDHTGQIQEELILHVYHGTEPTDFTFYEDDGDSYGYQEGVYQRRVLRYLPAERKVILEKSEGSYSCPIRKLRIIFHHAEHENIYLNGETYGLARVSHSFFSPMEKYDPINEPQSMGGEDVRSAELIYSLDRMEITW